MSLRVPDFKVEETCPTIESSRVAASDRTSKRAVDQQPVSRPAAAVAACTSSRRLAAAMRGTIMR